MSTNDRRKTFNTPLEFWQWAIQAPGKRKAKNKHGVTLRIGHTYLGVVKVFGLDGGEIHVDTISCPLTAVEDEHGAIEEDSPEAEIRKQFGSLRADVLIKLIDERIASATVEMRDTDGVSEWKGGFAAGRYCLKPKGDSQ